MTQEEKKSILQHCAGQDGPGIKSYVTKKSKERGQETRNHVRLMEAMQAACPSPVSSSLRSGGLISLRVTRPVTGSINRT